jgi:hypothetical protein
MKQINTYKHDLSFLRTVSLVKYRWKFNSYVEPLPLLAGTPHANSYCFSIRVAKFTEHVRHTFTWGEWSVYSVKLDLPDHRFSPVFRIRIDFMRICIDFMRIRIQLFRQMRIWVQFLKWMLIYADPDPGSTLTTKFYEEKIKNLTQHEKSNIYPLYTNYIDFYPFYA